MSTDNPADVTNPYSSPTGGSRPSDGQRRELPERPSTWPVVVGILGGVFGGLGILGAIVSILGYAVADTLAAELPEGAGAAFEAMSEYKTLGILAGMVGLGLATVLLISSVGMTRRRAWSVPLILGWAIFQLLLSLPTAYLQYLINQRQFEAMPEQPPGFENFGGVISVVTILIGLLWTWALPVFLLIWFSRAPVKAEVASWAPEESGLLGE